MTGELVKPKRKPTALEVRRRKALARISAASAFFGSLTAMAMMAVILFFAGSLHVSLTVGVLFCLGVSTVGGYWFGRQSARMIPEEKDSDD